MSGASGGRTPAEKVRAAERRERLAQAQTERERAEQRAARIKRARTFGIGFGAAVIAVVVVISLTRPASGDWSPFGTVVGGRLDTDLLVTRQTRPLRVPAEALVRVIGATGYAGPVDDRFT